MTGKQIMKSPHGRRAEEIDADRLLVQNDDTYSSTGTEEIRRVKIADIVICD